MDRNLVKLAALVLAGASLNIGLMYRKPVLCLVAGALFAVAAWR